MAKPISHYQRPEYANPGRQLAPLDPSLASWNGQSTDPKLYSLSNSEQSNIIPPVVMMTKSSATKPSSNHSSATFSSSTTATSGQVFHDDVMLSCCPPLTQPHPDPMKPSSYAPSQLRYELRDNSFLYHNRNYKYQTSQSFTDHSVNYTAAPSVAIPVDTLSTHYFPCTASADGYDRSCDHSVNYTAAPSVAIPVDTLSTRYFPCTASADGYDQSCDHSVNYKAAPSVAIPVDTLSSHYCPCTDGFDRSCDLIDTPVEANVVPGEMQNPYCHQSNFQGVHCYLQRLTPATTPERESCGSDYLSYRPVNTVVNQPWSSPSSGPTVISQSDYFQGVQVDFKVILNLLNNLATKRFISS
jgi:hypothetical protein